MSSDSSSTPPTRDQPTAVLTSERDAADSRVVTRRLVMTAVVLFLVLVVGYIGFVLTAAGHTIDNEAYLGRKTEDRFIVRFEGSFLAFVTRGVFALMLLALVLIGLARRRVVLGLVCALGVLVAVAGAELFKHILPWSALIDSDGQLPRGLQAETYPSGHATIGTSFALALVLLIPVVSRSWFAPVAGMLASLFTVGVFISGWHRPSDAIGGLCWATVVMSLIAAVLVTRRGVAVRSERRAGTQADSQRDSGNGISPVTPLGDVPNSIDDQADVLRWRRSAVVAAAVAAVFYLMLVIGAMVARVGLPDADLAYLVMAGLILFATFATIWWFSFVLRATDWAQM